MSSPASLLLALIGCALLLGLPGCGAIRSTVSIVQAEKVVKQARGGATPEARYPMALAEELLAKAREEQGYADYSRSFSLANEAKTLAQSVIDAGPTPPVAAPTSAAPIEPAPALTDGDDDDSAGDDDDSAGAAQ